MRSLRRLSYCIGQRAFCLPTRPLHSSLGIDPPEGFGSPHLFDEEYGFYFRAIEWLPHADKVTTGGEDAYLATDRVLMVADGVGWWSQLEESATSPADAEKPPRRHKSASQQYSESLMREALNYCEVESLGGPVHISDAVEYAYEGCKTVEKGSATLAAASLVGNQLEVFNLGDCGMLLIRNNSVFFRTEELVHGLNFPYQLGVGSKDTPSSGVTTTIAVRQGDIVVMASDGIFDNVFESTILEVLKRLNDEDRSVQLLAMCADDQHYDRVVSNERRSVSARAKAGVYAQRLLKTATKEVIALASSNANDPRADTPFAAKCVESGAYHEGGKPDDMTLIMATITPSLVAEGVRFGVDDGGLLPPPYKNWP